MRSLGLVAIGTVADCVPLVGENQDLVARGLQILNDSRDPYMDAFRTALDLDEIQERDLGWRIGPVLNAGGRLSSAMRNLDILASRDPHLVRRSVRDAVAENTRRKHITQDLVDRCVQLVERMTRDPQDPIVLADPGFHAGVVGIAAGRLAERFAVPAAVIALDPVTGIGKGSLRSAGRVHLAQALTACAGTVLRGGGHAAAAGITIQSDRVAAFTRAFAAAVRDQGHPDRGRHVVMIDAGADLDECDLVTVRELDRLGPFGQGNPVPTLALTVTIDEVRPLGSKHFVMIDVHDATGTGRLKVIDGRTIPAGVRAGATLEVAVEVSAGSFRGTPQVDLLARAWREPLVAF
jgi:single-stranded-DNA-specific exonuclease